jgi:hypothetical protein
VLSESTHNAEASSPIAGWPVGLWVVGNLASVRHAWWVPEVWSNGRARSALLQFTSLVVMVLWVCGCARSGVDRSAPLSTDDASIRDGAADSADEVDGAVSLDSTSVVDAPLDSLGDAEPVVEVGSEVDATSERSCFPRLPFEAPMEPTTLVTDSTESVVVPLGDDLLVVRADHRPDTVGIYLDRRHRSGASLGSEQHIVTEVAAYQPRVVPLDDGFLISYTLRSPGISNARVWVMRLDSSGTPIGAPTPVSDPLASDTVSRGLVGMDTSGLLFVHYRDATFRYHEVITLDAEGGVAGRQRLSFMSPDAKGLVAGRAGDSVGLVWKNDEQSVTGPSELLFATVDRAGSPRTSPTQVTEGTPADGGYVDAGALLWTGGRWALVYALRELHDEGEQTSGIFLQLISTDVEVLGSPRSVSDSEEHAVFPSAVWDGRAIAIAWQDSAREGHSFRLVDPDGGATATGVISDDPAADSLIPKVFWLEDRYALTWNDWYDEESLYRHQFVVTAPCE